MEEILGDFNENEKISFLKWWERKRLFFNLIIIIWIFILDWLQHIYYTGSPSDSTIVNLIILNIFYSGFSIVSIVIEKLNISSVSSFFQNLIFWQFLFLLKVVVYSIMLAMVYSSITGCFS